MRTFIAIELPKEIKAALSKLQDQLKASWSDVKWVAPENIHLTLKFLGEVDQKKLEKIANILEEAAKNQQAFYLRIYSLGVFPKINFPRVIWVGVDKGDNETKELAKALEERIAKIGIPKEKRPFSSHITIGRFRSFLHQNQHELELDLKKLTNQLRENNNWQFQVKEITFFKSTLAPKGPFYEVLKQANLKTA